MSLFDAYKKTESLEGLAKQLGEEITKHFEKEIQKEQKRITSLLKKQERILKASVESVESASRKALKKINTFIGGG